MWPNYAKKINKSHHHLRTKTKNTIKNNNLSLNMTFVVFYLFMYLFSPHIGLTYMLACAFVMTGYLAWLDYKQGTNMGKVGIF